MKLCLQTKDNFYTSTTPNYAKGNSKKNDCNYLG